MATLTKGKSSLVRKRWRVAFTVIYSSRAFSRAYESSKRKNYPEMNQSGLTLLVKEKDLGCLEILGGVEAVAAALKTDLEHGIHEDHAEAIFERQKAFGRNTYLGQPAKSFFRCLMEAFKDSIVLVNIFGVLLSIFFGIKKYGPKEGWYEGGSIIVAVSLVISVSAICKYRQSRQLDKLSQMSNNIQVEVIRNRRRQQISIFDVVVGDVVFLNVGDQVCADGLFVAGHSLLIDESSMTGETYFVEVDHGKNPFLLSGTKVADGYARFLVTSVGMNTAWGEMMTSISQESACEMPLQVRLNKLTFSVSMISLVVAFIVNLILLLSYFTGHTKDEDGKQEFNGSKTRVDDVINGLRDTILSAISILFITIPHGLPLAITLVLSYSMKRMVADQAMVRNLSSCETMGSTTTICTDKTGTLTLNEMKVTKFWLGQKCIIDESHVGSIQFSVLEFLHQGAGLNTTGGIYKPNSVSELEFSGSATEKAILSWAVSELKMDMEVLKRGYVLLHAEVFNSEKKRSGILVKKTGDNTMHVHWKGAPEIILLPPSHFISPV